jgi:hypothetical protein
LKAVVLAHGDLELRVAHALSADPNIERIAYIGEGRSGYLEMVTDAVGFDVVVGIGTDTLAMAAAAGAAAVIAANVDTSPVPTVCGASLVGAALALAARLDASGSDVLRVAVAEPTYPGAGSVPISFPPPVGRVRGSLLIEDPYPVVVSAAADPWAAVLVQTNTGDQAVVDDHKFLAAVCLAAGVDLLPPAGVVRVWDGAATYLARAEAMGMVAAGKGRP